MIDMEGPCICPGDRDHATHPSPCGGPNSGTGHGPWCAPCNTARFARIKAGLADIKAALSRSPDPTHGEQP